jgi:hypothetical protein
MRLYNDMIPDPSVKFERNSFEQSRSSAITNFFFALSVLGRLEA